MTDKEYPDYILYRGSRDELNLLCRKKDDEIAKLKGTIKSIKHMIDAEMDLKTLDTVLIKLISELDQKTGESLS